MAKKELKSWLKSKDRDYQEGIKKIKNLKIDSKKNAFFDTDEPQ